MQAIVECLLLYSVCGGKRKRWQSVQCSSFDWCKQMWGVHCCIWYVVLSIRIGKVFNIAVSIGANDCGMFVVVVSMWW